MPKASKKLQSLSEDQKFMIPDGRVSRGRQSCIPPINLGELAAIWESNKSIPTSKSRRAWANARNLNPTNVNNWFYRRKKAARKKGFAVSEETYELPVGNPPAIPGSLPPSSPLPETPRMQSSEDICVKKEDPYHREAEAAALLSDDSRYGFYAPTSSDPPEMLKSVFGSGSNLYDNQAVRRYREGLLGVRVRNATESASASTTRTTTPLTPAEANYFNGAHGPSIVQQSPYPSVQSAYMPYVQSGPRLPSITPSASVASSGKGQNFCVPSIHEYYNPKDIRGSPSPIIRKYLLSSSVFNSAASPSPASSFSVPALPTVSALSASPMSFAHWRHAPIPQAPSPLIASSPVVKVRDARLLQNFHHPYQPYDRENALRIFVDPGGSAKKEIANASASDQGAAYIPHLTYPSAEFVVGAGNISDASNENIAALPEEEEEQDEDTYVGPRLYLPEELEKLHPQVEGEADTQEREQRSGISTRAMQDPDTFSWCLGGKRFTHDGFFLCVCECSSTNSSSLKGGKKSQHQYKRYEGCTGPW